MSLSLYIYICVGGLPFHLGGVLQNRGTPPKQQHLFIRDVTKMTKESMWPTGGRRKHELIHIHMICCRCPLIGVGPHCPHLLGDTLQYLVPHYPGLVFHTGDMGECISHTFSWWHKRYVLKVKKLINAVRLTDCLEFN